MNPPTIRGRRQSDLTRTALPERAEEDVARQYLNDIYGVLRRRWRLILGIVLLGLAAATYFVERITPLYAANGDLIIQTQKQGGASAGLALLAGDFQPDMNSNETEAAVLRSASMAERVIAALSLDKDPWFNPELRKPAASVFGAIRRFFNARSEDPRSADARAAAAMNAEIETFAAHLTVTASDRARIISIRFVSPSPVQAATIVNALADAYAKRQSEMRLATQRQDSRWLTQQTEELRDKVIDTEKRLLAFRLKAGLSMGDADLLGKELAEYNAQLLQIQLRRVEAENRARQMSGAGDAQENLAAVMDSPTIQRLESQRQELARKLAQLQSTFRSGHPQVQSTRAELADVEGSLKSERQRILSSTNLTVGLLRDQEIALNARIRDLQREVAARAESEADEKTLELELKTNTEMYGALMQSLKQATSVAERGDAPDAQLITRAIPADKPFYPNKPMLIGSAAILSALFAVALSFLLELMDSSYRNLRQIEAATGIEPAGSVPLAKLPPKEVRRRPALLLSGRDNAHFAERIRSLRVALTLRNADPRNIVLLVTSSVPEEGKSFTALMLAGSFASAGSRVAIVDCDIRNPSIGRDLLGHEGPGLVEHLIGQAEFDDVVVRDELSGIDVVSAGRGDRLDPPLLLGSAEMGELVKQLRAKHDVVILDSPPVTMFSDALPLLRWSDRVLYCVRWGRTRRETVLAGLKSLLQGPAEIAIALTQVDLSRQSRYDDANPGPSEFEKYYRHSEAADEPRSRLL